MVVVVEKAMMMVVVVVMMVMAEELRKFDLRRLCLSAARLILAQRSDRVRNRLEQVSVSRRRREFRLLRRRGLSAGRQSERCRCSEQAGNLLVHV